MVMMGKDEGVFNATNRSFCVRELARHVVVNDSVNPFNVQAAGRKVRGHQEVDRATAKEL